MYKSKTKQSQWCHTESLKTKIDYYENKLQDLQDTLSQQQEELLHYSNQNNNHKMICPEEIELKSGSDKIIDLIKKKMNIVNQEISNINDLLHDLKQSGNVYLFWDIENTCVPSGKNAYSLVSIIKSYVQTIYPDNKIIINCYFEENNLSDKHQLSLNDAGCHLHIVPNPHQKKERANMPIIRDLFDMEKPHIVGLISSDGDFKPYLDKLADRDLEFFVITNNHKYHDFLPNIIEWNDIIAEL